MPRVARARSVVKTLEPKVSQGVTPAKKATYTPILVLLLIVASFFLGSLYTKVTYLEQQKNSSAQSANTNTQAVAGPSQPTANTPTNDDIKKWAKDVGLDTNKFNSCFSTLNTATIDKDVTDGTTAGVSGTPSFVINGTLLVGAQPYSVFKQTIDQELSGNSAPTPKVTVDTGHLPFLGQKGALVTIVEFSDFQCPYCRQFFNQTLSQLKKDYIDTGKVVFYYRQFPLDFHPMARPFAIASECANQQGKFWEMHDKIFSSQS